MPSSSGIYLVYIHLVHTAKVSEKDHIGREMEWGEF